MLNLKCGRSIALALTLYGCDAIDVTQEGTQLAFVARSVSVDGLVGAAETAARLGSKRTSVVHDWRRRHAEFPEPVATLQAGLVWRRPDVADWAKVTGPPSWGNGRDGWDCAEPGSPDTCQIPKRFKDRRGGTASSPRRVTTRHTPKLKLGPRTGESRPTSDHDGGTCALIQPESSPVFAPAQAGN